MIQKNLRGYIGKRSLQEVSKKSGVPISTLKRILYDEESNPSVLTLKALCDELNIGIDDLFVEAETEQETALLNEFRNCSDQDKHSVMMIAKAKAAKAANKENNKHIIKVLSTTNSIVDGMVLDTCMTEVIETHIDNAYMGFKIPNTFFTDHNFFMNDIILLEFRDALDGEFAVFTDGNKAFFRRLEIEGNTFTLKSLKKNAPDIIVDDFRKWRCLGVCIGKA